MMLQSLLQTVSLVSGITEQLILNPYDAVIIPFWSHVISSRKSKRNHLLHCQSSSTSPSASSSTSTHTSTSVSIVKIENKTEGEITVKFEVRASDWYFSLITFFEAASTDQIFYESRKIQNLHLLEPREHGDLEEWIRFSFVAERSKSSGAVWADPVFWTDVVGGRSLTLWMIPSISCQVQRATTSTADAHKYAFPFSR